MDKTRKKPNFHTSFTKKLWIFLILGAAVIILGLVNIGLYFNIQTLTTSTEQTEVLPGYIISLASLIAGSFILILFWRRPYCLVIFTLVVGLGTASVCVIAAALTITHVLQPLLSLSLCSYSDLRSQCTCASRYSRQNLRIQFLEKDTSTVTFLRTSSCDSIQSVLPTLLYCECGVYLCVFILIVIASVIAFLVLRLEKANRRALREEPYEEIFSVSGGSSVSDDNDSNLDIGPGHSYHTPTSKRKIGNSQGHNTCPPGILKNPEVKQMSATLIRSKSCDSIDQVNGRSLTDLQTEKTQKGKSKLKEHRRRDKRAVTLHNLDTQQLLLILDLRMRYLEETRLLKSQGHLDQHASSPAHNSVDIRRSMTPQPYKKSQANTMPRSVRSHTPQPGQKAPESIIPAIPDYRIPAFSSGSNNETKDSVVSHCSIAENIKINNDEVAVIPRPKSRPSVQQYFLPSEPIHRSKSAVPFKEPLHRENHNTCVLPPQPLTRQIHQIHNLPPEPIHRDGSAFQIVGHPHAKPLSPILHRDTMSQDYLHSLHGEMNRAIRDNFKLYPNPFMIKPDNEGHLVKPPQHISTARSLITEPPPPYAPPPTYQHFVALSQDESSVYSQDEENIYESYEPYNNRDNNKRMQEKYSPKGLVSEGIGDLAYQLGNRRKESQESSVPESEDDVFMTESLRSKLSRTPQSINSDSSFMSHSDSPKHGDVMQQPFIPIYKDVDRRRKPKKRSEQSKRKSSGKENKKQDKTVRNIIDSSHGSFDSRNEKSAKTLAEKPFAQHKTFDNTESVDHVYSVSAKHRRGDGQSMSESSDKCLTPKDSPTHLTSNGVYDDIDDIQYARNDTSSQSVSSQASLLSTNEISSSEYAKAIDKLHPGLGDPRVLETMM